MKLDIFRIDKGYKHTRNAVWSRNWAATNFSGRGSKALIAHTTHLSPSERCRRSTQHPPESSWTLQNVHTAPTWVPLNVAECIIWCSGKKIGRTVVGGAQKPIVQHSRRGWANRLWCSGKGSTAFSTMGVAQQPLSTVGGAQQPLVQWEGLNTH